ncbi:HAMP domain-containing histidine kinase [Metallumcola ferriviriculae]|uniref:histidine kinase n=1 Tax=Metallumcola ferriviriculae TaxID=3039180 RepID=A0AAU0UH03_9FIRM|nr:HAMP domain-containing histidine kinase [Desulfitibacteraceae bacterium MK1]
MSLRARLTLWYTTIFGGTLIVFGLLLYFTLATYMLESADQTLSTKADQVLESTQIVKYPFRLKEVVLPDVDVFASPDTFLQVVDSQGRVQSRSGNLGNRVLPLSRETLSMASRSDGGFYETLSASGSKLRLYNLPVVVEGQFVGVMQVGRSLVQVEGTLARLRLLLMISILASVLIAATVGWLLARTALNPIEKISSTAAKIGDGQHLNRRIDYSGPADEVGQLAATFNAMLSRLQQAYKRLEDTYSAQRRFVADASHELRSPLTTIGGNVELLQKIEDSDPQLQGEILADISEETRRMRHLVEDMLALARADAGLRLDMERINLGELLTDVGRTARRRAAKREFAIQGLDEIQGMEVSANKDYLHQAVFILIDNAIKYTSEQGRITLSVERYPGKMGISVRDNGQGISGEDIEHIFERFYRIDAARKPGGTGLGLAIAKWIAKEHRGEITVESIKGQGSKFTIWLPIPE